MVVCQKYAFAAREVSDVQVELDALKQRTSTEPCNRCAGSSLAGFNIYDQRFPFH